MFEKLFLDQFTMIALSQQRRQTGSIFINIKSQNNHNGMEICQPHMRTTSLNIPADEMTRIIKSLSEQWKKFSK